EQAEPALLRLDRQLAGPGAHRATAHPGDVAQVEQLEDLVGLLADLVLLDEGLQVAGAIAQREESGLPHGPDRHHAAGDRVRGRVLRLELLGGVSGVDLAHVGRGGRDVDVVSVGMEAPLAQGAGLLLPEPDLILDGAGRARCRLLGHRAGCCTPISAAATRPRTWSGTMRWSRADPWVHSVEPAALAMARNAAAAQ